MVSLSLVMVTAALVLYLYQVYTRFSRHGVKNLTPVPIIGTIFKFLFKYEHVTEEYETLRKRFPNERFVGKFTTLCPIVVVFDPDIIKRILMTDFHHFRHRTFGKQGEKDDFMGTSLFFMTDYQEWKLMRKTIIQSFTNSKINGHIPNIRRMGQKVVNNVHEQLKQSKDDFIDINARKLVVEFVLRSLASCIMSIDFDGDEDGFKMFYKRTLSVSIFKFSSMIKMFFLNKLPQITELVTIALYSESTKRYFRKMIINLMDEREANSITKHDLLQNLMNSRKDWSDDCLIAQVATFIDPARDTTIEAAAGLLYELVMNPDILDRLVREIDEQNVRYGGKLDFDALQEMRYLDMVVSESLRMWSPSPVVDRTCTIDYNLGKPNKKSTEDYIIRAGEDLHIPAFILHRDPRHFPDPLRFDPERFSDENRKKISPYVYMPFGAGRRICPGSRFAICEMKVLVVELLRSLELSAAPKTPKVPTLNKASILYGMDGEHWIRVRQRRK